MIKYVYMANHGSGRIIMSNELKVFYLKCECFTDSPGIAEQTQRKRV